MRILNALFLSAGVLGAVSAGHSLAFATEAIRQPAGHVVFSDDEARKLIEKMGSIDEKERKAAESALEAMGEKAMPALEKAIQNRELDEELRFRLEGVKARIRENPQGLAPEKPAKREGLRIRLPMKSETRSVAISPEGTVVKVEREGQRFEFRKDAAGAITARVRKQGAEKDEAREFKNEADLEKQDPELFKVYKGEGFTLRVFGEAPAVEPPAFESPAMPEDIERRMHEFQKRLEDQVRELELMMADGELDEAEVRKLADEARKRLERDMERFEERERDARRIEDAEDRAEELAEIEQDRYIASLRALERDLVERIDFLKEVDERRTGGKHVSSLDDLIGRIRDTYADLRDKVRDEDQKTWKQALKDGRKFHEQYGKDIADFAKKIDVKDEGLDADSEVRAMRAALLERLREVRREAGERFEDNLDGLEDRIRDTFADLRDKIEETPEAGKKVLESARKFYVDFAAQLEAWAKKARISRDLENKEQRRQPRAEEPREMPRDPKTPERDVKLPPGEEFDLVAGVRVSRLTPLMRSQLGLENGLSVNEIVDADGPLAAARLEVYDIILELNGEKQDTRDGLRQAVKALKPGGELKLKVLRKGKTIELTGRK
jgi:hypothetical protein